MENKTIFSKDYTCSIYIALPRLPPPKKKSLEMPNIGITLKPLDLFPKQSNPQGFTSCYDLWNIANEETEVVKGFLSSTSNRDCS